MAMSNQRVGKLRNALRSPRGARIVLYGVIGIFLGILAPFGTDGIGSAGFRVSYWLVMIYGGAMISIGTTRLWKFAAKPEPGQIFSLSVVGLVLATALPITAMVVVLGFLFTTGPGEMDLVVLYFYVVTITAAVTVGTLAVDQSFALKSALAAAEEQARSVHAAHKNQDGNIPPAAFAARLKDELRQAEVLSVSADDHYLDVVTSKGRDQIRCTVADAALELAPIDGRVIHRSHWVARSAIKTLVRSTNRSFVKLTDERELPVSRNRLRQLLQENWFPN